jgi:hypothetical protein
MRYFHLNVFYAEFSLEEINNVNTPYSSYPFPGREGEKITFTS